MWVSFHAMSSNPLSDPKCWPAHQGVVTAAVSLIERLAKKNPDDYRGCVSLAVSRLTRVRRDAAVVAVWCMRSLPLPFPPPPQCMVLLFILFTISGAHGICFISVGTPDMKQNVSLLHNRSLIFTSTQSLIFSHLLIRLLHPQLQMC